MLLKDGLETMFWHECNILHLDRSLGYVMYTFVKTHGMVHLLSIYFII